MNYEKEKLNDKGYFKDFMNGIENEIFIKNNFHIKLENLLKKDNSNDYFKIFKIYLKISNQFYFQNNIKKGKKYLEKAIIIEKDLEKNENLKNKIKINLILNELIYWKTIKDHKSIKLFLIENKKYLFDIKDNNNKLTLTIIEILFYFSFLFLINKKNKYFYNCFFEMKKLFNNYIKTDNSNELIDIIYYCKKIMLSEYKKMKIYGFLMSIYFLKIYYFFSKKSNKDWYKYYSFLKEINIKLINNRLIYNSIDELYKDTILNNNTEKKIKLNLLDSNKNKINSIKTTKKYKKKLKKKEIDNLIKSNLNIKIYENTLYLTGNKLINNDKLLKYLRKKKNKSFGNKSLNKSLNKTKKLKKNFSIKNKDKKIKNDIHLIKDERPKFINNINNNSILDLNINHISFKNKSKFKLFSKKIKHNGNCSSYLYNNINLFNKLLNKRPLSNINNNINNFNNLKPETDINISSNIMNNSINESFKKSNFKVEFDLNTKHPRKSSFYNKNIYNHKKKHSIFFKNNNKNKKYSVISNNKNKKYSVISNNKNKKCENIENLMKKLNIRQNNNNQLESKFSSDSEKSIASKNSDTVISYNNYINKFNYLFILFQKIYNKEFFISFNILKYFHINNKIEISKIKYYLENCYYDFCIISKITINDTFNTNFYGQFKLLLYTKNKRTIFKYLFYSKRLFFCIEDNLVNFPLYDINKDLYSVLTILYDYISNIYNNNLKYNICDNIDMKIENFNYKNIENLFIIKNIINLLISNINNNYIIVRSLFGFKLEKINDYNKNYKKDYIKSYTNFIKNKLKIKYYCWNRLKNSFIEKSNNKIVKINLTNYIMNNKFKRKKRNLNNLNFKFENNNLNMVIYVKFICSFIILNKNIYNIFYIFVDNNFKVNICIYKYKNINWKYSEIVSSKYLLNDKNQSKIDNIFFTNFKVDLDFINNLKYNILEKYNLKEDKQRNNVFYNNFKSDYSIYDNKNIFSEIKNKIYYGYYKSNYSFIAIKIRIINDNFRIYLYDFKKQTHFIYNVINEYNKQKLINILVKSNTSIFNSKMLNFIISFSRGLIGKNITLKDSFYRNDYIFSKSSTKIIKYNLITNLNNSYLRQNFIKLKYFFPNFIKTVGNCYIIVNIFHSLNSIGIKNIVLIKFEIFQKHSKIKLYKMILNSFDFENLFNIDIEKLWNNKENMIKVLQELTKKIKLEYNFLYNKLVFPFKKIKNYKNKNKLKIYFLNKFNKYLINKNKNDFNIFLKKVIYESSIVLKKVVFINKKFAIIKVEKHNFLKNKFSIFIYFPHNKRNFHTLITTNDIINLDIKTMKEIFKFNLQDINTLNKITNYNEFIIKYKNLNDEYKNKLITNNKLNYLSKIKFSKLVNFKFWDNLLVNLNIVKNNDVFLLNIDKFNGILREIISQEVFEVDDDNYCLLEIFFGNNNLNMLNMFNNIELEHFKNHSFFIRIIYLSKNEYTHNDKINLYDIYNHIKDKLNSLINKKMNLKTWDLNKIRFLSYYINKTIKRNWNKSYFMENITNEFKNKENLWSRTSIFKTDFVKKMYPNSKLSLNIREEIYYKKNNDLLLYRDVISIKEKKILIILFNEKSKKLNFTIYNSITKKNKKIIIPIFKIIDHIPYFHKMLNLKLFLVIGKRLFKLIKNKIIIIDYKLN